MSEMNYIQFGGEPVNMAVCSTFKGRIFSNGNIYIFVFTSGGIKLVERQNDIKSAYSRYRYLGKKTNMSKEDVDKCLEMAFKSPSENDYRWKNNGEPF